MKSKLKKESKKRIEHGIHNLNLCTELYNKYKGTYNDWIATTAFYSIIHFLQGYTIPFKYKNPSGKKIEYETEKGLIDEIKGRIGKNKDSRHNVRALLVEGAYGVIPKIDYMFINDTCYSARYKDYKVSDKTADKVFKKCNSLVMVFKKHNSQVIDYNNLTF